MNGFFRSQLSFWSLVWMSRRTLSNIISKLHERSLCVIYMDKLLSSQSLHHQGRSVSIYTCNHLPWKYIKSLKALLQRFLHFRHFQSYPLLQVRFFFISQGFTYHLYIQYLMEQKPFLDLRPWKYGI